jgi:hypothetical protein
MSKSHRSPGNFLGAVGSQATGGTFDMTSHQILVGNGEWPTLSTNGLITHLDAGNPASYPGTGTVWYDLSPSGYNYNIVASAYRPDGPKYMDFRGQTGSGIAKSAITTDPAAPAEYTIMCWTRVREENSDWRTFYRPYNFDHQVIIHAAGWEIGMRSRPKRFTKFRYR